VPGPGVNISQKNLISLFERGNIATLQSMLIKKSAYEAAGGFDKKLYNNEDWDFNLRLSRLGPIGFDETALVIVYDSADGISKNQNSSLRSYIRIFSKLRTSNIERSVLATHATKNAQLLLLHHRPQAARRYVSWAIQHGGWSVSRSIVYAAAINVRLAQIYFWLRQRKRLL
jgi:GT2 family glycosyltransferase